MFSHLGLALRVFRELRDLSQSAVARAAGIGKSQLSKYESGKELPKLDSLEKVLRVLEVEPLELFYMVGNITRRARHLDGPAEPDPIDQLHLLGRLSGRQALPGLPDLLDLDVAFEGVFRELLALHRSTWSVLWERAAQQALENAPHPVKHPLA